VSVVSPVRARPALSVLEFELVSYKRTWRGSALSSFVIPMLFVLGFGLGVGHYVDVGGRLGPVRYLDFIAPGMLAATAMQVAFGEATWPVMGRLQWIRTYHAMVATPLRVIDIIAGDMLFVLLRVVTTAAVYQLVIWQFGAVRSWWGLAALPICGLLGLAVAAPTYAFTGRVEVDSYVPLLFRLVVIPMSLFAGVFFPVSTLPEGLRLLAYASPLWHAVELCRATTLPAFGLSWASWIEHLGYLGLWAVAGTILAQRSFRRRLVT
jgi:Nod factor-specific ABC transporter NodJ protein